MFKNTVKKANVIIVSLILILNLVTTYSYALPINEKTILSSQKQVITPYVIDGTIITNQLIQKTCTATIVDKFGKSTTKTLTVQVRYDIYKDNLGKYISKIQNVSSYFDNFITTNDYVQSSNWTSTISSNGQSATVKGSGTITTPMSGLTGTKSVTFSMTFTLP